MCRIAVVYTSLEYHDIHFINYRKIRKGNKMRIRGITDGNGKCRCDLVEEMHDSQRKVDRMDYLIRQAQKEAGRQI